MTDTVILPGVRVSRSARMIARRWVRRAARYGALAQARGFESFLAVYEGDWACFEYRILHVLASQVARVSLPDYVRFGREVPHGVPLGDVIMGRPVWGAGGAPEIADAFKKRVDEKVSVSGIRPLHVPIAWTRGGVNPGVALCLARAFLKLPSVPDGILKAARDWARRARSEVRPDNPVKVIWGALTNALEARSGDAN